MLLTLVLLPVTIFLLLLLVQLVLFSCHFLHSTHRFYVILSILYTLFLSHDFSPDSIIMGTIIPIPKNRKQSLCNSSNHRAIALSSIFGKILDWVILIKEKSALCYSHIQFGFQKGYPQRSALIVC